MHVDVRLDSYQDRGSTPLTSILRSREPGAKNALHSLGDEGPVTSILNRRELRMASHSFPSLLFAIEVVFLERFVILHPCATSSLTGTGSEECPS